MAKEPDNLVLERLRALSEVQDRRARAFEDVVQLRLGGIELRERLERSERRLELADAK